MIKSGKINVFLISGRSGSGKSFVSKILYDLLDHKDVILTSFSYALKSVCLSLGWDGDKYSKRGRRLLQEVGNSFRNYDSDTWVNFVINKIERIVFPPKFAIIDDWRFQNEFEVLNNNPLFNVIKIKVFGRERDLHGLDDDISEHDLDNLEDSWFDLCIDSSTSTPEDIRDLLSKFLNEQ